MLAEVEFVHAVSASGVNFSIFTHFFVFFLTKTVKIRLNWRWKIFSLKIRGCKILDKFHVWSDDDDKDEHYDDDGAMTTMGNITL